MNTTFLITGASGMIGTPLVTHLTKRGHEVRVLVRRQPKSGLEFQWDPAAGTLDEEAMIGVKVVVNLNGKNIADERWSERVRQELWSSRIDSAKTIVGAIQRMKAPPAVFISASATGFYGDRANEELTEASRRGSGFLADLSEAWEDVAAQARSGATRVVTPRLGMVIGNGGALAKMVPIFRFGLGGPIGNGQQYWPWIHLQDVVEGLEFLAENLLDGPVNFVAPQAATCRDFATTLGRVMHRPAVLPAPSFAVKAAMGQMGAELLLASSRAVPAKLLEAGYQFRYHDLESALDEAVV